MICNNLVDLARIATPIISLAGLGLIWYQLYLNSLQRRRERTFDLHDKYYQPDFVDQFMAAGSYAHKTPKNTMTELFKNEKARKSILITLNYFEELGLLYMRNLIDRDVIDDLLSKAAHESLINFKWIIDEIRDDQKSKYKGIKDYELSYRNWEDTVELMLDKSNPIRSEIERIEYLNKILPSLKLKR